MHGITIVIAAAVLLTAVPVRQASGGTGPDRPPVSFKNQVFPLIKKHCLPCHAEDNFNPSGLVLDTYETLMAGGEHGQAIEPGSGTESMLVQKLAPRPPFGEMMPLEKRRKKGEIPRQKLSEEEVRLIVEWIDQGAKDN